MLSKIAQVLGTDEERLIIEAGRLPKSLRQAVLEWARRDLSGFKKTVTASAVSFFELRYHGSQPIVRGDLPNSLSDESDPSEDDGGGEK